jgi:RNA polymerase sigma-70 factor, ECF subfamily
VSAVGEDLTGFAKVDRAAANRSVERDAELNRLADLASRGDLAALLEAIRPMVVQYCRARIGTGTLGSHSAEDVAQDTLFAVCGALERWHPGRRVMSFVYGIASNKVVDAYRAAGQNRSVPTDAMPEGGDARDGPEQTAVLASQVRELHALLDRLPDHQREVLVLRLALGLSAVEAAEVVGSTPGAVRVTQHRALTRLRGLQAKRTPTADLT